MKHPLILLLSLVISSCTEAPHVSSGDQEPSFVHANFIGSNTCESCHEMQRPAAFADEAHGGGGDCGQCHAPKDDNSGWLPNLSFNHVPKPSSCLACHVKERPAAPHVQTGDCAGCHNFPSFKPS